MGVLGDLVAREVGRPTSPRLDPVTNSVGTSAVVVARANANRVGLTIVNLSAVSVYLKPRLDVSSTSGIRLAPSGGSLSLNWRDDFDLVGWEWYAIADAAASSILVLEVNAR